MDAQLVDIVVGNAWLWWIAVAVATLVQLMLLLAVWRLRSTPSDPETGMLPRDRHTDGRVRRRRREDLTPVG